MAVHPATPGPGSSAADGWLMQRPAWVRRLVLTVTVAGMIAVSLPKVPRTFVDYRHVPLLSGLTQPETFGTDTIADMYEAKVVLNDPADMYTKTQLAQTPLEAATWSREASAPYPPAVLLVEAALYAIGTAAGVGLYGMILLLAVIVIGLSLRYCLRTRWYLFPLLYLNFAYFSTRFVSVQDGSYLVMLTVILAALTTVRARRAGPHLLVALAITMKLSPLFYLVNLGRMRRGVAVAFVAILAAGLVLPYFVWDNYLYIFRFNDGIKGHWYDTVGAAAIAIPFAVALAYVQARLDFDWEDRIGWGLVPFALFLGFKMNVARHLLIVLLVPDKRVWRTAAAAVGLALPVALPSWVRFNSALPITAGLLTLVLVMYLRQIGWSVVAADWRHPGRTMRECLGDRVSAHVEG
jgi:hypothetical protein